MWSISSCESRATCAKLAEKHGITAERVIGELTRIALADIGEVVTWSGKATSEVFAAAQAIGRLLATHGQDWHALADQLCSDDSRQAAAAGPQSPAISRFNASQGSGCASPFRHRRAQLRGDIREARSAVRQSASGSTMKSWLKDLYLYTLSFLPAGCQSARQRKRGDRAGRPFARPS